MAGDLAVHTISLSDERVLIEGSAKETAPLEDTTSQVPSCPAHDASPSRRPITVAPFPKQSKNRNSKPKAEELMYLCLLDLGLRGGSGI